MNRKLAFIVLAIITLDFAALSAYAIWQHGYWGIIAYHLPSSAGWQVGADLVIACTLAMAWMVADARRNGRVVWPYLLITLALGSFGPLLYLLAGLLPARQVSPLGVTGRHA